MAGVFLSYRRKDSDYATLLYAWLTERFGPALVFWDREDIDAGEDFREVLTKRLREADALVALIGPEWSPSPWIQREIGAALRRKSLVLPVVVGDHPHLDPQALPRSIRKLASLQALEARDLRFRQLFMEALSVLPNRTPAPAQNGFALDTLRLKRLVDLLEGQIDRNHRQALRLLLDGKVGDALTPLNETFELVMALLDLTPGDARLETRLGFLYKDLAQAFDARDKSQARRYLQSGVQLFEGLVERPLERHDAASAWNGLGNMHLLLENWDRAVECCQRAVQIDPSYGYGWADLFMGLSGQAAGGRVNLPAMRQALQHMKAAAHGDEILTSAVPGYEQTLKHWERESPTPARKTRKT